MFRAIIWFTSLVCGDGFSFLERRGHKLALSGFLQSHGNDIDLALARLFPLKEQRSQVKNFLAQHARDTQQDPSTRGFLEAVKTRVSQAKFIVDCGCCREREESLIRDSFLLQPSYFTQRAPIVFENEGLCVVDKPFDTQIQSRSLGRFPKERTVLDLLGASGLAPSSSTSSASSSSASSCDDPADSSARSLRPAHNLDFATSGLLVFAKTDRHLAAASAAFSSHHFAPSSHDDDDDKDDDDGSSRSEEASCGARSSFYFEKEYRAVVLGWVPIDWDDDDDDDDGSLEVRFPISADPNSPFKMTCLPTCSSPSFSSLPSTDTTAVQKEAAGGGGVVDPAVAARWGPSRLPPARRWNRDSRAKRPRSASTKIQVCGGSVLGVGVGNKDSGLWWVCVGCGCGRGQQRFRFVVGLC
jgi:hypothetical protein